MLKGGSCHRTSRIFYTEKTRNAAAFCPGPVRALTKFAKVGLVLHRARHMRANGQYKINETIRKRDTGLRRKDR